MGHLTSVTFCRVESPIFMLNSAARLPRNNSLLATLISVFTSLGFRGFSLFHNCVLQSDRLAPLSSRIRTSTLFMRAAIRGRWTGSMTLQYSSGWSREMLLAGVDVFVDTFCD